ncbi:DUF6508 domain-containing protein [Paucilactobacillus nenjiangensis]|jgi:UDP-galactopyranose mutase|uniref:DUF6508 domain-containing protein n=1 Tax=Paucilactobacillus nenjiangensis TaxID=1296540 RepID=UPI0010F71C3F|nr:DUF6508 domain-containing protein [Paucilactobacillus nenjiangensis]
MDLKKYLEYFKNMQNKEFQWTSTNTEDGILQMGYPMYDQTVLTFVRDFKESNDFDAQYKKTLKAQKIKIKMNQKIVNQVLAIDTIDTLKAMLTLIVTAEEVDEGSWARALQEGFLYQVTNALVNKENEG